MPVPQLTLTQNDLQTLPLVTVEDTLGNPIDLSGAAATFRMVDYYVGTVVVNNGAAQILQDPNVPATKGQIQYLWQSADVSTPGFYLAWFLVTTAGRTVHYPQGGFFINILQADVPWPYGPV
jgi:hypothetical protein